MRRPMSPDDFDFPMSYSCYRFLCQEHGWQDPGSCELPPIVEEPKVIYKRRPVDDEIDQLKAQNLYLLKKLNEHIAFKRQRKGEY